METQQLTLTEEQAHGLRALVDVLARNDSWMTVLTRVLPAGLNDDFPVDLTGKDWKASLAERFGELSRAADRRDLSSYFSAQRERNAEMAAAGLSLRTITQATTSLRDPLVRILRSELSDREEEMAAVDMLDFILMETVITAGEVYATQRQDDVEDEYRQLVRRLSTPVIEVWDGIQILPLVGVIDSTRAQQMTEQLLDRIVERQARMVIVDITGVPTVDTAVADHLMKTVRAASLVGARAILVGISPQVAQTLVRLGLSLGDVETFADLRSGLERALQVLGHVVEKRDT
jgi:anti-anti-sigma regulatory factor